ncbi:MAG: hypothetical protein P8P80_04015 [Crocinitomicaceae bacterium]|nr:hypothetical protein [Crocinitomicaceae bacterium]
MNPELEKLIEFALADGVITDKEREIIRKKAEKLGEDPDEAEMILDVKLAMQNKETAASAPPSTPPPSMPPPSTKQKSSKVGDIMTCPACGATADSMKLSCGECGHEFRNTGLSNLISEFKEKIEKAETNAIQEKSTGLFGKLMAMVDQETDNERKIYNAKANIIKNFPIPSNKEDLIEFMTFSTSQSNGIPLSKMDKFAGTQGTYGHKLVLKNAWTSMADSIQSKAQFLDSNDTSFIANINEIHNKLDR